MIASCFVCRTFFCPVHFFYFYHDLTVDVSFKNRRNKFDCGAVYRYAAKQAVFYLIIVSVHSTNVST